MFRFAVTGALSSVPVMMPMGLVSIVEAKEINVVATNSIIGDYVRNVGGDLITQSILVGPDGDPHTFEPSPKDAVAVKNADVMAASGALA